MQNKRIFHWIKLALTVILLVGLYNFFQNKEQAFERLYSIEAKFIVGLVLAHITNYLLLGIIYNSPLKKISINLKFNQWFGLAATSNLFNLVLPAKGGTALRWLYLKENLNLGTRRFIGMNFYATIIGMIVMGVFGLGFAYFATTNDASFFQDIQSAFWFLTIVGFGLLFFPHKKIKIFKAMQHLDKEIQCPSVFITTAICFFGITLLYPVKTYLSFSAMGLDVGLIQSLEISMIILLISIVPVLPGNIGIKELATAYIASQYNISPEVAVLATLTERATLYSFLVPCGLIYYANLFVQSALPWKLNIFKSVANES